MNDRGLPKGEPSRGEDDEPVSEWRFHSGDSRSRIVDVAVRHGERRGGRSGRQANTGPAEKTPENYSPFVNQNFPDRVLWGATHIHTGLSADAGLTGVTLVPADMFRYARGEVVTIDSGLKVRLDRPLDWFAVTDHAEYLGLADQLRSGDPALLANPTGKKWYDMYKQGPQRPSRPPGKLSIPSSTTRTRSTTLSSRPGLGRKPTRQSSSSTSPGVFTTLHGFEWTSAPEGNNLHRTVIFRDGVDRVKQIIPFSAFDSQDPADLWKYMDRYEKLTGGQVLAIPHNGNLSNGLMYTAETYDGKPMDAAYAEARISHEPVMEVTQVKGDGETHPFLSPNDEFANFERWFDVGNIAQTPTPKQNSMLQYEYARSALKLGLQAGKQAWGQPLPVRHGRRQRSAYGRVFLSGRQLPRSVSVSQSRRRRVGKAHFKSSRTARLRPRSGWNKPRAWAPCGRARTPARRSGTR